MGQRNPDRVSIAERHHNGQDVAAMARSGWDVISRCQSCGLMMQVDLRLVAYVSGPRTSLWNRHARCRRLHCGGMVDFEAKAPGMSWHERLVFNPDAAVQPGWAQSRLRELAAAKLRAEADAMCNHYKASADWRLKTGEHSETRIPARWAFDLGAGRVNVQADDLYPGYIGEILAPSGDDELVAAAAVWRFMPAGQASYAEWSKKFSGCNNAQGEKADSGWPWRFVARTGRCLIPGEAIFEWDDAMAKSKGGAGKTEYRFALPDDGPFFFAGLCGRAEPREGPMLSYTMVTKAAGGDTAAIGHPRQPIVLRAGEIAAWLDPAVAIRSFTTRLDPAGTFTSRPVKGPKAETSA